MNYVGSLKMSEVEKIGNAIDQTMPIEVTLKRENTYYQIYISEETSLKAFRKHLYGLSDEMYGNFFSDK